MEHQPTESQTMMFCHGCAKPLHVSAVACPSCGAPQRKRAESTVSAADYGSVTRLRTMPAPGATRSTTNA